MRRFPRRRYDHAEAVLLRVFRKIYRLFGRPVRGLYVNFRRHFVFLKFVYTLFKDRQITVAAHDDRYFFHVFKPPLPQKKLHIKFITRVLKVNDI